MLRPTQYSVVLTTEDCELGFSLQHVIPSTALRPLYQSRAAAVVLRLDSVNRIAKLENFCLTYYVHERLSDNDDWVPTPFINTSPK